MKDQAALLGFLAGFARRLGDEIGEAPPEDRLPRVGAGTDAPGPSAR